MNAALAPAAVVVRRTIAASAEDLFDAWLDPQALAQWMRPAPSKARWRTSSRASAAATKSPCRRRQDPSCTRACTAPSIGRGAWCSHRSRHSRKTRRRWSPSTSSGSIPRTEVIVITSTFRERTALASQGVDQWPRASRRGVPERSHRMEDSSCPGYASLLSMGAAARSRTGARPRVRWALEEAGLAYTEKLLGPGEQNSPAHRAVQPFGQVPVYEEAGSRCSNPAPLSCTSARSRKSCCRRTRGALARTHLDVRRLELGRTACAESYDDRSFFPERRWARLRRLRRKRWRSRASMRSSLRSRPRLSRGQLHRRRPLDGLGIAISATRLDGGGRPVLAAYQARCEARPALKRALAAQLAHFEKNAPIAA